MRKTPVFTYERERITLRHGARAALVLERECPASDCVAARHAKEISSALFAHAEREYFPVAARELEQLVAAGRGFAFTAHRIFFRARLIGAGAGRCMQLSLLYSVGGEVRLAQSAKSFWTADGTHRYKRVPREKRGKLPSKSNCCAK